METEYSVEIYRKLEEEFHKAELYRPMYMDRFVKGTELTYDVTGVDYAHKGQVDLEIDRFVGGIVHVDYSEKYESKFDPEVKKFLDDLNEAYEKSKNSSIVFK